MQIKTNWLHPLYFFGHILPGDNFCIFLLPIMHTMTPFWKGVYSKRKEFAPTGSKFFPFRIGIPFQTGVFGHILPGDNFCNFLLPIMHTMTPFWKGVYSKRKEFAPTGSKFFPFRVGIPFQKGDKRVLKATSPGKSIESPLSILFFFFFFTEIKVLCFFCFFLFVFLLLFFFLFWRHFEYKHNVLLISCEK